MPRSVSVAAIVLNFNGGSMLRSCLDALQKGTVLPHVYLVDNASSDDSLTQARQVFPGVTVIENSENLGFARGMNVGIRRALAEGADYVWLVNNDALVAPDALENLLAVSERSPHQGLWSPAIYTLDGTTPWFLGGKISYFRMRALHQRSRQSDASFYESGFLTGCALFLSRNTIERCGLLDEHYFLYYEDVAYSVVARRAGCIPTVVPLARVEHAEKSEENPEKTYWLVRSGIDFFRHESPWYWRPWIFFYLLLRRAKNALDVVFFPTLVAREVKRAYTDAFHENHV